MTDYKNEVTPYTMVDKLLTKLKSKEVELFIDTADKEAGGARSHICFFRNTRTKMRLREPENDYLMAESAKILFSPFEKKERIKGKFYAGKKTDDCKPIYGTKSSGPLGNFVEYVSDVIFPNAVADVCERLDYKSSQPDSIIKPASLVKKTLGSPNHPYAADKQLEYRTAADWRFGPTLRFDKVTSNPIMTDYYKCIEIAGKVQPFPISVTADNIHTELCRGYITTLIFTMGRCTRTAANGVITFYLGFDVNMIIVKPVTRIMDPSRFMSATLMQTMAVPAQAVIENNNDEYNDECMEITNVSSDEQKNNNPASSLTIAEQLAKASM